MATTLSEINDTLSEQNDILYNADTNIDKISSNFQSMVDRMAGQQLDDLEAQREKSNQARKEVKQAEEIRSMTNEGASSKGGFSLPKLDFGGIGKLFAGGSLVGIGLSLGKTLLTRGIPGLILNGLADGIGDYIESETGSKELGDAAFRASKLAGIGLIFGKKFALIGAVLGSVLTPENIKQLDEIGNSLGKLASDFNIELPSIQGLLEGLSSTANSALVFINSALKGDFSGMLDNVGSFALAIGGLFAVLSPRGALSLAFKSLTASFGLIKATVSALPALAGSISKGAGALFAASPIGIAAGLAGSVAYAVYQDNKNEDELAQLKQKQASGEKLTFEEGKRLQNLSTSYDNTDYSDPESQPTSFNIPTDPTPVSSGKIKFENSRGRGYNDPRMVSPKAPLEKNVPAAAVVIKDLNKESAEANNKPIVVMNDNAANINTTSVNNSQAVVTSMPSGVDYSDPFFRK